MFQWEDNVSLTLSSLSVGLSFLSSCIFICLNVHHGEIIDTEFAESRMKKKKNHKKKISL